MRLQFKQQQFQADAARAVTDVFEGQQIIAGQAKYMMDIGADKGDPAQMLLGGGSFDADGWKNIPIQPEIRAHLLAQIQKIQKANFIKPSQKLEGEGINLTVEMETGVGKTYTYIKTIHELYSKYGWMKFIVVVPSIAIREGVHKSFRDLEEHFMLEYHRKIQFFVYNSSRLGELDAFAKDSGIHVMIINSQAFAANFDAARNVEGRGGDKAARIIFTQQDAMGGRRPIDVIAAMNPVIVIDEPQSVEGPATVAALRLFKPLFTLRYSATHRNYYNLVYRLDAVDALRQHLVKKIAVKGITQTVTAGTEGYLFLENIETKPGKPPAARLRFDVTTATGLKTKTFLADKGFNLYEKSGRLTEYKSGYVITDIDASEGAGFIEFQNGMRLKIGQTMGGTNEEMLRRIQIRETIKTHLAQEEALFHQNIKCLSLFFIDEVAKYKTYEGDVAQGGVYAKIFEEEYAAAVAKRLGELELNPDYMNWLRAQSAGSCHAGYFSIDKRTKRLANPSLERGRRAAANATSNDVDAFDLIMKGKERLLSFDDPEGGRVRFIFSHSALREGWDNPNVFQICTLKEAGAEIRKRQEVGRGLRLCVNKFGERQDESVLGNGIYDVNVLTVVASESYESFSRDLQRELLETIGDRPTKVEISLFQGAEIERRDGTKATVRPEVAQQINNALLIAGYVDPMTNQLTSKYDEDKAAGTIDLGPMGQQIDVKPESIVKILDQVFNPQEAAPVNATGAPKQEINYERFNSAEFKALWAKINAKSAYTVTFDSTDLVKKSIESLNANLHVPPIEFIVTGGALNAEVAGKAAFEAGTAMEQTTKTHETAGLVVGAGYRTDLVGQIVDLTQLTRRDVAEILAGMAPHVFAQYRQNPEAFIRRAATLVNEQKANVIIEDITYNPLEERFEENIFSENLLTAYPGSRNVRNTQKGVYNLFVLDSDVEVGFCKDLEASAEVKVYTKLPRGFYIDTPVGKYNPDWAIVFEHNGKKHVYFVAETKGTLNDFGLDKVESAKIKCARKHFKAIAPDDVTYEFVNSYAELHNIIMNLQN